MRKKLLTTICAFSTMSILCTTPVMAQTTRNCDISTLTNGNQLISICNATNCQELEKTIFALELGCNLENLSDYLQNLINLNCNGNSDEITEPDEDTNLPEQDTDIPEEDNSIPEQDTDIPDEDNNIPEHDTDTPEQDTNLPEQDTNIPEQDNNSPEQNTATPVPEVTATPEITSTPVVDNTENADFVSQVATLVNKERAKVGLSPVTLDTTLSRAAQVRAKEIVNYFSHTRPNGSSFSSAISEQGISFRGSGENIAYGQRTPEAVMNAWMNSEGHRANILNANYTKIGVGYYQINGVNYWTQLFTF